MPQITYSQPSRIVHNNQSGYFITDSEIVRLSDILSAAELCDDNLRTAKLKLEIQEEINDAKSNKIEKLHHTVSAYAGENDSLKTEIDVLQHNYYRVERKLKRVKTFGIFGL